jgi:radical SAM protein with 4Fe4S-binding SPASM domain
MCPVSQKYGAKSGVQRGFMNEGLFELIADQLDDVRPAVAINLGGESTLHPRLPDMIRRLKDSDLYVFLDTNATRLDESLSRSLITSGLDRIALCLDGDNKEEFEMMRCRASFAAVIDNISTFLRLRNEMKSRWPYVIVKNIQFYDSKRQEGVPNAFRMLFKDNPPDEFRFTWADYWPGDHRNELTRQYTVQPISEMYSPCLNLWQRLPISWDGMVYICCLDLNRTVPIGDLKTATIRQLWNSDVMQDLRKKHRTSGQAELSLCRNCNQIRRPSPTGWLTPTGDKFTRWRIAKVRNPSK